MVKELTPRGFAIFNEIATSYSGKIRVQESSNVIPSVWLCVEESVQCGSYDQHLNVSQAIQLRNALNEFISWYGGGYDEVTGARIVQPSCEGASVESQRGSR
jgi:hypothetical protein